MPPQALAPRRAEGSGPAPRPGPAHQPSSHDTWSRCAPIRLAGYEEDPEGAHLVRGID